MYDWVGRMTRGPSGKRGRLRWLARLPRPLVLAGCSLFAWVGWALAVRLSRTIQANMAAVLPHAAPALVRRLARRYFRQFFVVLYELLVDAERLPETADGRFATEGEDHLRDALGRGKGVILFAPHMGNFFYYYWYLSRKYDCLTVATAGSRELRPLYERFHELGCQGLDYDATPPLALMRALRGHLQQNGVVLLLGDFWRPFFPPAPLFGRMTRSPEGTATLALEQEAAVIPFYGFRERGFRHRLVLGTPLYLHEKYQRHQREEATAELNRLLERMILAHPDQWFYWFQLHERWEQEDAAAFRKGAASG